MSRSRTSFSSPYAAPIGYIGATHLCISTHGARGLSRVLIAYSMRWLVAARIDHLHTSTHSYSLHIRVCHSRHPSLQILSSSSSPRGDVTPIPIPDLGQCSNSYVRNTSFAHTVRTACLAPWPYTGSGHPRGFGFVLQYNFNLGSINHTCNERSSIHIDAAEASYQ